MAPMIDVSSDKYKALVALVRDQIETDPFEYDSQKWAAQPLAWYVRHLGVCDRQVRRWIADLIEDKILVKDQALDRDRKRVMVLRLGKEGYSKKQQAKLLTMILEKHLGRDHTPYEFGICFGLVEAWGTSAPQILKLVLKYPVPFINCARGDPKCTYYRFINTFDSYLRFLSRFAHVAPEFASDVKNGVLNLGPSDQVRVHEVPYWQAKMSGSSSLM